MFPLYTTDQVRAAENALINQQKNPDQLMRIAAGAVAEVAQQLLLEPTSEALHNPWDNSGRRRSVVLLVGPGGNGGDALYAGAELREMGYEVSAYAIAAGRRVKESAKNAYDKADGQWVEELPIGPETALVIDGIAGLGSARALSAEVAEFLADVASTGVPVVAIDVPSGVNADTGAVADDIVVEARGFEPEDHDWATQRVPAYVQATKTVTFGGLRYAHALSPWCGEVVLVDLELPVESRADVPGSADGLKPTNALKLSEELWSTTLPRDGRDESAPVPRYLEAIRSIESRGLTASSAYIPNGLPFACEPGPTDHKYSGGVAGLCAGSETFPGAGIFAAVAAVRATSSAVRLFSPPHQVVGFTPEALITADSLGDFLPSTPTSSSPHALVVGPGRGTGDAQAQELATALQSTPPLILDADALTLLSQRDELMQLLRDRDAFTLLTPHAGEFARIAPSDVADPSDDPVRAAQELARELGCTVLLKGRSSILASSTQISVVNAGSSWAATPGSGDVLAGLLGAYVARAAKAIEAKDHWFPAMAKKKRSAGSKGVLSDTDATIFHDHVLAGLHVHSVATEHAAIVTFPPVAGLNGVRAEHLHGRAPLAYGEAPATALQIANAISSATAAIVAAQRETKTISGAVEQ